MGKKDENTGFICKQCKKAVVPIERGTYRNHCPFCLFSLHVDNKPGDRLSECGGKMEPVQIRYHSKKGYQILHKCQKCGFERYNIISEDLNQPDNMKHVYALMQISN